MKELVRLWPSVCHCWRTSVVLCLVRFGTLACHDSFIYPLIYPPLCVLPMIAHGLFILTWSWGSWLVLCCWGAGKRALHVSPLSFRCNKPVITMSRPWGYALYFFVFLLVASLPPDFCLYRLLLRWVRNDDILYYCLEREMTWTCNGCDQFA